MWRVLRPEPDAPRWEMLFSLAAGLFTGLSILAASQHATWAAGVGAVVVVACLVMRVTAAYNRGSAARRLA